jgi:hypothetical protein
MLHRPERLLLGDVPDNWRPTGGVALPPRLIEQRVTDSHKWRPNRFATRLDTPLLPSERHTRILRGYALFLRRGRRSPSAPDPDDNR